MKCGIILLFYEQVENKILRNRAKASLEYYIRKAVSYKHAWITLSVAGIILPSVATFMACVGVPTWVLPLITAVTAIASSMLALFKCADKKTSYRNSAENIKSELSLYSCQSGVYKDAENRDNALSISIERIIKEGYNKIAELENSQDKQSLQEVVK